MKRTLSIKRETLVDLTYGELSDVAGGQIVSGVTCPLTDCVGNPPTFPPRCYSAPWC